MLYGALLPQDGRKPHDAPGHRDPNVIARVVDHDLYDGDEDVDYGLWGHQLAHAGHFGSGDAADLRFYVWVVGGGVCVCVFVCATMLVSYYCWFCFCVRGPIALLTGVFQKALEYRRDVLLRRLFPERFAKVHDLVANAPTHAPALVASDLDGVRHDALRDHVVRQLFCKGDAHIDAEQLDAVLFVLHELLERREQRAQCDRGRDELNELGEGLASGTPAHRRIVRAQLLEVLHVLCPHALVLGGLFVGGRNGQGRADPGGEPVLVAEVADQRCHVKGMVLGGHGVRDDLEGLYRGVPDAAVLDQAKALQRLKERVGELLPANGRDKLAYRGSDGLEYVVIVVAGLRHERHELVPGALRAERLADACQRLDAAQACVVVVRLELVNEHGDRVQLVVGVPVAAALVFGVYVHLLRHGTVHWSAYPFLSSRCRRGEGGAWWQIVSAIGPDRPVGIPPCVTASKANKGNTTQHKKIVLMTIT